jgi:hypothetical protein
MTNTTTAIKVTPHCDSGASADWLQENENKNTKNNLCHLALDLWYHSDHSLCLFRRCGDTMEDL